MGETAESADPDLIEHLATRFIEVYRDMLEWAADLRSARVPEPLQPVFRTASHLLDRPLEQIREFVDRWVAEMDEAPQRLESGKTVDMILDLDLYDEQMFAAFERQTRAAAAALGRAAAPTAGQQTAGFAASFLAGYYGSKAAGHILKDIFRPIGTLMRGLGKLGK